MRGAFQLQQAIVLAQVERFPMQRDHEKKHSRTRKGCGSDTALSRSATTPTPTPGPAPALALMLSAHPPSASTTSLRHRPRPGTSPAPTFRSRSPASAFLPPAPSSRMSSSASLRSPTQRHTPSATRQHRLTKENQFVAKFNRKHHSYSLKAPYPANYEKDVLDLDAVDNAFIYSVRDSNTFVDYSADGVDPPARVLDLGCGSGCWTLAAAKEWPECDFVGFDLVNIQPPIHMLDDSIANRVQWVHGNFLTCKLPFDDDEFDHVHIRGIARAVPENKWDQFFEEVNRVLTPGGAVEMIEEDIVFPTLPRWFTQSLRMKARQNTAVHLPTGSRVLTQADSSARGEHDHALLELLFNSVYDSRFVNRKPLAILPSYFSTYFRNVICGPVVNFPMPPLPPIPEPPRRAVPISNTLKLEGRPREESFSSTETAFSSSYTAASEDGETDTLHHTPPSSLADSAPSSPQSEKAALAATNPTPYFSASLTDRGLLPGATPPPAYFLIPLQRLERLGAHTLAMHLRNAYLSVAAVREAMWDELSDRIRNKLGSLNALGWDTDEEINDLPQARKRFEVLLERYVSDMEARTNIGGSLESVLGWKTPRRDPLTKAELIEEERVHQAMWEARQNASAEDLQTQKPSRAVRVIVGRKAAS